MRCVCMRNPLRVFECGTSGGLERLHKGFPYFLSKRKEQSIVFFLPSSPLLLYSAASRTSTVTKQGEQTAEGKPLPSSPKRRRAQHAVAPVAASQVRVKPGRKPPQCNHILARALGTKRQALGGVFFAGCEERFAIFFCDSYERYPPTPNSPPPFSAAGPEENTTMASRPMSAPPTKRTAAGGVTGEEANVKVILRCR